MIDLKAEISVLSCHHLTRYQFRLAWGEYTQQANIHINLPVVYHALFIHRQWSAGLLLSFASNCFFAVVEPLKYDMIGPH